MEIKFIIKTIIFIVCVILVVKFGHVRAYSKMGVYPCGLDKYFIDNPEPATGCAEDIKKFAENVSNCGFWVRERTYKNKKERSEQIAKAIERLRCDSINEDGNTLSEIYSSQPENQDLIKYIIKVWSDYVGIYG